MSASTSSNSNNNPTMNLPPAQQPQPTQTQPLVRKTNDNSNPQQGSSGVGTPTPSEATTTNTSTAAMTPMRPHHHNTNGTEGRTNMMKSPPTKKDSRKLFVGGLPADVVESEFREFFEQFGEVLDSVVMFDRETRRSRGFGFVTFRDPDVAEMLLNTRQDEEAAGGTLANDMANGQRVGRLVMRGKTCEVKAAEPKEASRSARRFQNQGFNSTPSRPRFVDKAFNSPGGLGAQGGAPHHHHVGAPHHPVGAYHDPHSAYMVGHHHHPHYPMMSPAYYPGYPHHHPGMYSGAGYHHQPGPSMYAPMGHHAAAAPMGHAAAPVQNDRHHPAAVVQQPIVPPSVDHPHMEGPPGPYGEPMHMEGAAGHHLAYGHPHEGMVHSPYPGHAAAVAGAPHMNPKFTPYYAGAAAYPAPGTSNSAMHPAAPGIPPKDDKQN